MPKSKRLRDLCTPLVTFNVSRRGIKVVADLSDDGAELLTDLGRRIPCPIEPNETLLAYAHRLRQRLAGFHREERVGGAVVHMLILEVDAVLAHLTSRRAKKEGTRT